MVFRGPVGFYRWAGLTSSIVCHTVIVVNIYMLYYNVSKRYLPVLFSKSSES